MPACARTSTAPVLFSTAMLFISAGVGCPSATDEPDGSPCDTAALGGGVLHNDVADIDFADATVTATLTHKSDIDSFENGCLARAEFDFVSDGCSLNLVFDNPGENSSARPHA